MVKAFSDKMKLESYRHGMAWVALNFMLAIHVVDEVLTDFLSFYNPLALLIREKIVFLPLPMLFAAHLLVATYKRKEWQVKFK